MSRNILTKGVLYFLDICLINRLKVTAIHYSMTSTHFLCPTFHLISDKVSCRF